MFYFTKEKRREIKIMRRLISILLTTTLMFICCVGCEEEKDDYDYDYDYDDSVTVYVSNYGKIHSVPYCSGMKYYTEMDYDEAIDCGYDFCQKCYY